MAWMQRLDPDRRRRRLRLLAQLAGAKAGRGRGNPGREDHDRLREVVAARRRLAG